MRVALAAERAGVPAVVNTCESFVVQAHSIAGLGGEPWLPVVFYPGHIDTYDLETRETYISELVAPGTEEALTTQIAGAAAAAEAPETAPIMIKGTWDDVLTYYREKMWSDGLPIIPPTIEKVEEFLKYTDYPADAELTRTLPPSGRIATPWSVAVNGVMAGCRPEYMPILIAMAKCGADPKFTIQDQGSTPGWEALIILNGPIIKQLNFNYRAGVMKVGYQANTSVGRFWKLFMRNIPEIRVETESEKGTIGKNWDVVVAENEDACRAIGWETFGVQQGFMPDDNVVTMQSTLGTSMPAYTHGSTAKEHIEQLTNEFTHDQGWLWWKYGSRTQQWWTMVLMTPVIGRIMAEGGYSKKEDVTTYFYEHCKLPAGGGDEDYCRSGGQPCDWPQQCEEDPTKKEDYCASEDPNRLIPVFVKGQTGLVLTGDPERNQCRISWQNHSQGRRASMKIELPKNWDALLAEAAKK